MTASETRPSGHVPVAGIAPPPFRRRHPPRLIKPVAWRLILALTDSWHSLQSPDRLSRKNDQAKAQSIREIIRG